MCLLEFTDFDLYGFELDRMVFLSPGWSALK